MFNILGEVSADLNVLVFKPTYLMFLDGLSQSASDVGEDIVPANIISKVSLLVLHFPRLRIVWSRSLHATADIFAALKANQDEPDLDRAMRVGVPTEDGLIEGDIRFELCLTLCH